MPIDRPETGLVILYNFLWAHEHDRGAEHGRKARPACVVVPLTGQSGNVVLFPLTTREPGADRLAVKVPETERRTLQSISPSRLNPSPLRNCGMPARGKQ